LARKEEEEKKKAIEAKKKKDVSYVVLYDEVKLRAFIYIILKYGFCVEGEWVFIPYVALPT
jgi:hypothetical protein